MENRKITNATPVLQEGIQFKSKLESKIYLVLKEAGLNPQYEPIKIVIWEGFKPTVPFFQKDKKTKTLKLNNTKTMDITYCPDFVFNYRAYTVFVEVKPDNFTNDVYPYKQKMFLKWLEGKNKEDNTFKPIFIRVGTIKNMKEFIELLKREELLNK